MDFTDVSFSKELAQNDPVLVNDEEIRKDGSFDFFNIFEQNQQSPGFSNEKKP